MMESAGLAQACLPLYIKAFPWETIGILYAMRALDRLDPVSEAFLRKALDESDNVELKVTLTTIRKFDPRFKEWGPRIVARLDRRLKLRDDHCLNVLTEFPPPDGAVPVVTRLLKHSDPLVRCESLNCLLAWGESREQCAAMMKAQFGRSRDDARYDYFGRVLARHLGRPGVEEAIVKLCGLSEPGEEFTVKCALYQVCRLVVERRQPVPKLPELKARKSSLSAMYLAWLESPAGEPRGYVARERMHGLLEEGGLDGQLAAELLLLSDPRVWPSVAELRRLAAIEQSDDTRNLLWQLLRRHPDWHWLSIPWLLKE
jgi:hypothetical protein